MSKEQSNEMVFDPGFIEMGDGAGAATEAPIPKEEPKEELNLFENNFLEPDKKPEEEKEVEIPVVDKAEETENETPPSKDTDESTSKDSLFSVVLGQELVEEGVLTVFDEAEIAKIEKEEGQAAAIKHMHKLQAEKNAEELRNSYDSGYQEYLGLIQGGVPKEEASEILQVENFNKAIKEINLTGETSEEVEARKQVLTFNYRINTKFSDEKIQSLVDRAYDEGSDIEEVEEAVQNIGAYSDQLKADAKTKAENDRIAFENQQKKFANDLKSHIEKTDEYFKGEKVNKEVKDKILKKLTTEVTLDDGRVTNAIWAKREDNPILFDSKLAYLELIGFFNDAPLDKFVKNATTKVTTGLQNFLADNNGRSFSRSAGDSIGKGTAEKDMLGSALGV